MKEEHKVFFERLAHLDTGDRAALKRCAGVQLSEADGRALTVFYRCLPPYVDPAAEERWFAVSCVRCLWDAEAENGKPLQSVLGELCRGELSDSTKHRVEVLLDTVWDTDGYMLTKLVRLIKLVRQKNSAAIDFSALLDDLLHWNADSQFIQRKWARAIFAPADTDTSSDN